MGILDSDIGYQIGLLAGGLWAERYRERGAEKLLQQKTAEEPYSAIQTPNHQENNTALTIGNRSASAFSDPNLHQDLAINTPSVYNNFSAAKPYTFRSNLTDPTQNTATKPYTFRSNLYGRR